ncbi:AGE family epimerase/isomerase [Clostridium swellfunianum]|uniref:AGE family epimerase/isomerase n=1 Tax=Clostridium swellfunianum TaxID=1367462 RepID=UPI00202F7CBB|nr:AGE family epimerase/isomerase [Clostridium swellfunianum]MCM0650991.1 AGE family epimerase/isomerase [Clostridium swellfunianum]
MENQRTELLDFYKEHVEKNMLPFWKRALDKEHGGVFTCFKNDGSELISTDKYVWSQGRFLWIWSTVYEMIVNGQLRGDSESFKEECIKLKDFLKTNVLLLDGSCAFLLEKDGTKKEISEGSGYDNSFYADCFVILGFSRYAEVFLDDSLIDWILSIYDSVQKRLSSGNFRSEPYPIPAGYKAHSIPMIMLNVTQELEAVLAKFNHVRSMELRDKSIEYMKSIMDEFCDSENRIGEMLATDMKRDNSMLSRHLNPGHSIESMWFVMHTAEKYNLRNYINKAAAIVEKSCELGWDNEFGGLLRFVDYEGGKPKGVAGSDPYTKLIAETWDYKLWWPHSEVLYSTLLLNHLLRDDKYIGLYNKFHEYVFNTFPNADKEVGEWIQIRRRNGEPEEKVVALPVKDPYHILRNLLLIIKLLSK